MMRRRLRLVALALIVVLVGLGVGYVQGREPGSVEQAADVSASRPRYPVPSGLAVFERAESPRDTVPGEVVRGLVLRDGTADPNAARRVNDGTAAGAWLMPGRGDSICHVRNGFATCPPRRAIEQRGAAPSVSFRNDRFFLDGVAADGVESVEVTYEDGERSVLSVEDNVFHDESERPPVLVAWTGPNGPANMDFSGFVSTLRRLQRTAPRNPR